MLKTLRSLCRSPFFTLASLATLALGIGANTAIFSVLHAVLLRPLPYPAPEQLMLIWQQEGKEDHSDNWLNYLDWKSQNTTFADLAIYRRDTFTLTGSGVAESLSGALASANFFATVGVSPILGRAFDAVEDSPGGARVVVLSHGLWQRRFGGSANVLGRSLTLNSIPHTIIGVMPEIMALPRLTELWVPVGPYSADPVWQNRGNNPGLYCLGRLHLGVSLEQARADLKVIGDRLAQAYPAELANVRPLVQPLIENAVGSYRAGLWTLMGAVALVLAIACANVASLLLARGVARGRELAIRAALGASRARLVRELLAESLVLSLAGGALGLVLAAASFGAMKSLAPAGATRFQELALDWPVLAFAVGLSLLTGVIFGAWPAWRASRPDLNEALQSGGRTVGGGGNRLRQWLGAGQVALTLTLLASAGLMLSSLAKMQRVQLGFEPANLLTFRLALSEKDYTDKTRINRFFEDLGREIGALPGVRVAASNLAIPLRPQWDSGFDPEDRPAAAPGKRPSMELGFIDANYFRAIGLPLLRGRSFTDQEGLEDPRGIVIDQSFADRYWPGQDPLGKRIVLGDGWSPNPELQKATVIGVVPTLKFYGYAETPRLVQAYLSRRQFATTVTTILVKTEGDPRKMVDPIRAVLAKIDPNVPLFRVQTMQEIVDETYVVPRLYSILLGLFAGVGLLLACLGLAGVVAYAETLRRREVGIRMALGADSRQVVGLMLRQGLLPMLGGLLLGLGATLVVGRVLSRLLFEVTPTDPGILLTVATILATAAAFACWIPARRAARVDPIVALRAE